MYTIASPLSYWAHFVLFSCIPGKTEPVTADWNIAGPPKSSGKYIFAPLEASSSQYQEN